MVRDGAWWSGGHVPYWPAVARPLEAIMPKSCLQVEGTPRMTARW
jgi:hypothetical protein